MFSGFHLSFGVGLSAGCPITIVQRGTRFSGSLSTAETAATRSSIGYSPVQTAPSPRAWAAKRIFCDAAEQS